MVARALRLRYSHKRSGRAAPQPEARRRPMPLLSRSVDQVGRKSETTLGIASLHFEIGAFTGAAPDQFKLPPGASNAGHRQRGYGERADAPAGTDAVGCPKSAASAGRRQRRMAMPMVPEPSAAS
jgi:hypothetical protein